ncbi:MAG: S9 family peptidase [Bacteroidales bacterium]|nr:S9 family peptidase [Bacteroidales bacterium]MCF8343138.1 S9 family peptidase [Bacteroidales bacterium]MCF8351547.1 S9 family peptidase [Bacteroidales bacterium]MCF8376500.1 S9 family peptidase [Bacteroidales bacterium]MCF8401502.1 S9 family peptidase [Bacteroidales bacterium]
MKKGMIFCFLIAFTSYTTLAQEKELTLKDAVYMNPEIFPERLSQLQWKGNTEHFTWVDENVVIQGNVRNNEQTELLQLEKLNKTFTELTGDTLKRFPGMEWVDDHSFMFENNNKVFLYSLEDNQMKETNSYTEKAENAETEKNNFAVAYTVENNLFISVEGKETQITHDEDKNIVNGQAVHRREFGIRNGTFWSPDGNYLAFYKKDESMVTEYPLVDITTRIATLSPTKYPMAGETSHKVTIGVYGLKTGNTIFLNTEGPADQYLTNISWGPDEKNIYVAVLNRDQNHLKLNQYDVETGAFNKTLFEEKSDQYVEPEHGMYFMNEHPDRFVWFSERDGFQHLYLYNTEGELLSQLTSGQWVVTSFLGFDPRDDYAFFEGNRENPINRDVYAVKIKNGDISRLSTENGTNNALFSQNKKYFINVFSDTLIARKYELFNNKGKKQYILLEDKNPMEEYELGEMDIFTLENEDEIDLFCRLIKPVDFDPSKKYPAIVYVYGGPHSQLVTNSWLGGGQLFMYYLARQGYVVFTLDNRGTANRGFEFESAIFRKLGQLEVEDQMVGVNYLKRLPYVDSNKIGVDGWSYGGFMTITMLLKHPEDFKVGVAGGPVIDWKYYEVMYGERYMDTPQSNPEGYEAANLLNYVENLKAKLLVLHGTSDPTVVWQNSLAFLQKCVEKGVQVDYFVYPGHPHNVRGKDRMHMYQKITNYFNDYLR